MPTKVVGKILPQKFFARDALDVALDLIGKHLVRQEVVLRITEVEAYRWPDDSANHCRAGKTKRNAPMWGPPGHAYVYLCYGIHQMLNLVTDLSGQGSAVLIRACEPIAGIATIEKRRPKARGFAMLTGPGKVAAALGIDTRWSGHALFKAGDLELRDGPRPGALLNGPRVGIAYAERRHIVAPWRIAEANSPWVSQRTSLRLRR